MDYIAGRYMADFNSEYERQLEDPSRFTIISFHNRSGAVDLDTCTNPNTQMLKPTRTDVTATAADARRPSHIKFVTYEVAFDFTNLFLDSVGGGPKTLNITTVAMLPQSSRQVLHDDGGNGVLTSFSTYHGLDNIRAMTPRGFRDEILDPFRQEGTATLVPTEFGRVNATIDTAYDESNHNQVLKLSFPNAC